MNVEKFSSNGTPGRTDVFLHAKRTIAANKDGHMLLNCFNYSRCTSINTRIFNEAPGSHTCATHTRVERNVVLKRLNSMPIGNEIG